MEYKTIIEIINEAESPTEAADVAGEYLRGAIETGVHIRCFTKPLKNLKRARIVFLVILFMTFAIGISAFKINKTVEISYVTPHRNESAIQPPLRSDFSISRNINTPEEKK